MTDDDALTMLKAIVLQWLIDAQHDEHELKALADWLDMDAGKLADAMKPCKFAKHRRMRQAKSSR